MDVLAVLSRLAAGIKWMVKRAQQCRVRERIRLPAAYRCGRASLGGCMLAAPMRIATAGNRGRTAEGKLLASTQA